MPDLAPYDIVPMMDRVAVILTPRRPYMDWAANIAAADGSTATPDPGGSVFLLPGDISCEDDARAWMREQCAAMFAQRLTDWCRDTGTWPSARSSWPLFTAWFDIRFIGNVRDMGAEA